MTTVKGQTKKSLLNSLNRDLSKLGTNLQLQEWIDRASEVRPEISEALDGIYCGHEGNLKEEIKIDAHTVYLVMGWYTVANNPKVEYAYFS